METDRELLERAARAAGLIIIDPDLLVDGKFMVRHISDGRPDRWNARDDDGDAWRLAVKLRLAVNHYGDGTAVMLPHHSPDGLSTTPAIIEDSGSDPDAAARRAVLRAAAALCP